MLETGPYTQLTQAELTVAVLAILSWDLDAMGTPTSVTVLAAQVTSPDEDEIDSIDLSTYPATFDVTAVVPAVPGPAPPGPPARRRSVRCSRPAWPD